jgi:hypothetical protein
MSNYGYHWGPCNPASGAGLAIAAVGAAVIYVNRHAIGQAASDLLEIVLFSALAAAVVIAAAAVLIRRHGGHGRLPSVGEQILAAQKARQVEAARQRPAIAPASPQLHIHFHGSAQADAAPVVLQAIAESKQQGEQR